MASPTKVLATNAKPDEAVTSAQSMAQIRVQKYAARKEELKRLWIDIRQYKPPSQLAQAGAAALRPKRSSSATSVRSSGTPARSSVTPVRRNVCSKSPATRTSVNAVTPAGNGALSSAQMHELMSRDLTPEDYELLLLLDQGIEKPGRRKLASNDVAKLPAAPHGGAWVGETCSICLEDMLQNEDVRALPCGHCFHFECIEHWLTSASATCPIDSLDVLLDCHGSHSH